MFWQLPARPCFSLRDGGISKPVSATRPYGKWLCHICSNAKHPAQALVLAPTRELARQIQLEVRAFWSEGKGLPV